jgi:translocation protein SEC66
MDSNISFRQRLEEYQSKVGEEREWWDRKKANIQEGFMKELEQEESSKKAVGGKSNSTALPSVQTLSNATAGQSNEGLTPQSSVAAGSDDDAVLVEAGGPAVTGTGNSNVGGKKKKKGKK